MAGKIETGFRVQAIAREVASHARQRTDERERLRTDPRIPREGRATILAQFDAETASQRAALTERARGFLTSFRAEFVMTGPPDYRPASAAEASWVAAICAMAPSFSPSVLAATLKDAAASGNTGLVAALVPLAESLSSYKKEFVGNGQLAAAVMDAKESLRTPEVQASDEARDWADSAEQELRLIENTLRDHGPDAIDVYVQQRALPVTLPTPEAP